MDAIVNRVVGDDDGGMKKNLIAIVPFVPAEIEYRFTFRARFMPIRFKPGMTAFDRLFSLVSAQTTPLNPLVFQNDSRDWANVKIPGSFHKIVLESSKCA